LSTPSIGPRYGFPLQKIIISRNIYRMGTLIVIIGVLLEGVKYIFFVLPIYVISAMVVLKPIAIQTQRRHRRSFKVIAYNAYCIAYYY
jgi:hypothetical protein